MKKIIDFLPHFTISLALAMIVIVILEQRNPMMKFLTSGTSKTYIIIFSICCAATALIAIFKSRKD